MRVALAGIVDMVDMPKDEPVMVYDPEMMDEPKDKPAAVYRPMDEAAAVEVTPGAVGVGLPLTAAPMMTRRSSNWGTWQWLFW
jgi:hypothetical protein